MKKIWGFLISLGLLFSCAGEHSKNASMTEVPEFQKIETEAYVLVKPIVEEKAVLVLFGGFPEGPEEIEREFAIQKQAIENEIAVLYMNDKQKLWLDSTDKSYLTEKLQAIFISNQLRDNNIYFGGFSSGGNVALLLSKHLITSNASLQPLGLFAIDSPVDLLELYRTAEKNLQKNYSELSVQEASWLLNLLNKELGDPKKSIEQYEAYSPYLSETSSIKNLSQLNELKIRFYAEPDSLWWKENRQNEPEDLNAYWIKKLAAQLQEELSNSQIEYISSENKGYRANGERHPHSWSIVDKTDLIQWMLKEEGPISSK